MQKKFKTGDRVYWNCEDCSPDTGTVVEDTAVSINDTVLKEDCVWVMWDSDGEIKYIKEKELTLITHSSNPTKQNNLSVQDCIVFLVEQGYSVTIAKK